MADTFANFSYPIFGGADYLSEYIIRDTVVPDTPKVTAVNDQTETMEGITEPNATITETGWVKVNEKWYYLASSGMMQTGWMKSGNDCYYLDKTTRAMKTGWVKDAGKRYYFYSNGKMAHDTKVGKYRLGHNGAMI